MMDSLRALDVDQRVALLFVALFGTLLAASATLAVVGLRERGALARARLQRLGRELAAVWAGAAVFWAAWIAGAVGATLLFGVVSFLALREFVTLMHTRRADHRSLILAFFAVLPLQYVIVAQRRFDLFTVFVPVYVFLALPVVSALSGDPQRFLERNAKLQWGLMVTVYGLSHAPALLLLDLPGHVGGGAFLLFFLVLAVGAAQLAQEAASRWRHRRPMVREISRSFSLRAWGAGVAAGGLVGVALAWITPFGAGPAFAMAAVAAGSGTLGHLVMEALKRDAGVRHWGSAASVTGAVGLLDRVAALCFAAPVFFHSVRWYFQT
jgi:phosphatidate cytidylyltransferase